MRKTLRTTWPAIASGLLSAWLLPASPAFGQVTPKSPEVLELVKKGLGFLDKFGDQRLGGKCVIGLAYLKTEPPQPYHPRVKEAVEACQAASRGGSPQQIDMYSNGLAVIFLCELGPQQHGALINYYLGMLKGRQKDHGGWGYEDRRTGDTSQSQYAALSYWEAHNNGFRIESDSAEKLAKWLMHTQAPSGAWGYQGNYSDTDKRLEQEQITPSMVAAAMGSSLIALDLFGHLAPGKDEESPAAVVPEALRVASERRRKRAPNLRSSTFDSRGMLKAVRDGDAWMEKNYKPDIGLYNIYYLYSTERFRSFQEQLTGVEPDSPDWYQQGYEYLKQKQQGDGSWAAGCGTGPDTAFAILFLVRSTQKMLRQPLGDLRIGRRGFPEPTKNVQLVHGELVVKQTEAALGDLLNMLDDESAEKLDSLANDPTALIVTGEVDEAAAQRLRQIVRGGSPAARLIATRTLGRTGDLDQVPTLIYAMTDPDERVVIEARDALRFISRRFGGFGLGDRFTEKEKFTAVDMWKTWYQSLRPDATVPLN